MVILQSSKTPWDKSDELHNSSVGGVPDPRDTSAGCVPLDHCLNGRSNMPCNPASRQQTSGGRKGASRKISREEGAKE
ncbi:hypothetical protein Dimus_039703 [Dionaea muscipula]